ncbi:PREDICTED: thymus-specific serine protease-like isoform X1 [Drosophila arizonae]|uniref:Thymus-specific serine protease-like isoform X1 n=1 Tax=Drosophila arizonae TaxID=7263 RepID=A0ABM1NNM4_DROAR|nr:PREDICTED: thymus-specific serine protease-like isoform X1 [Drosophila arizonae]
MKYLPVFLALLVPPAPAAILEDIPGSDEMDIPAFVQTLNQLHRGPPLPPSTKRANVETRWFNQSLDNFDDTNKSVWSQRVMINEDNFVDGSPIFLLLGGEWTIDPSSITSGLWVDIAKEHNGSLVYTEHRFFGESIPILPLSTENLKYHGVEQALADVVNVIKVLKEEDKYKSSKVVVSGGSYSASMVVWLKLLYPDVIVGGWASSAVLEAKVDFSDFMEVVGRAYRQLGGDYCYDLIDNATSYYEDLFQTGQGAKAKKLLNLCDSFDENNERDQWQLFSSIANIFAGIAQYQKPENYDLAQYCSVLRNFDIDDASALSKFVQWRFRQQGCHNPRYQDTVDYYKWAKINHNGSLHLSWFYQTCRQFGWFQSSANKNHPFGSTFPATMYTDMCHDVFGSQYTSAKIEEYIQATNKKLGGKHPAVENVYMTHGALDGWSAVGSDSATIIPQASHCSDVWSIGPTDSPALRAAKERVIELVREWLA